jgi:hypothetical protein
MNPRTVLPTALRTGMSKVTGLVCADLCQGSGQLDEHLPDDALLHGVMGGGDLLQSEAVRR